MICRKNTTRSVGEGKVFQQDATRIERCGAGHSACSKSPSPEVFIFVV
jgi:hypothetical protein